jgi:hypothetical protein
VLVNVTAIGLPETMAAFMNELQASVIDIS